MNRATLATLGQEKASTQTEAEIAHLRYLLKQVGAWPPAGDDLLQLIAKNNWSISKPRKNDERWLPRVIEDALAGDDIGARYPDFFQKLLSYSELRQSFIKELKQHINLTSNGANHVSYVNGRT